MPDSQRPDRQRRTRPWLAVASGFVAFTAFAGAIGLATEGLALGAAAARLPLASPVLGGVALAICVGVPFTVLAWMAFRGGPITELVAFGAGVVLVGWILVELAFVREFSFLQLVYVVIGAAFIVVGRHGIAGPLGRDLRAAAIRDARTVVPLVVPRADPDGPEVTEADLAGLPEPARRYLRRMGVVGRPRDRSFLVRFTGRFRRPGGSWMPCEAWQYNSNQPILRVFHMRIDVYRIVPMVGRDAYVGGLGSMRGKVFGLLRVADGSGREFDLGELVTYVNDALLLAPSMLLNDASTWKAVDDESFGISVSDGSSTVSARVTIDAEGFIRDFRTEDRWCDLPDGLVRAPWTTPIDGWTEADGRSWPTGARAVWHLADGPMSYIEGSFVPDSIVRNVSPDAL
jgi:hypothetical protein